MILAETNGWDALIYIVVTIASFGVLGLIVWKS